MCPLTPGPPSHHTPALGSCFPAAVVASPQTAERERNSCHLSPVKILPPLVPTGKARHKKAIIEPISFIYLDVFGINAQAFDFPPFSDPGRAFGLSWGLHRSGARGEEGPRISSGSFLCITFLSDLYQFTFPPAMHKGAPSSTPLLILAISC